MSEMVKLKDIGKIIKLGDVLKYEQPTKYIVSNNIYDNNYNTPVLTAGKTFILGYTNETENIFTKIPVIIFDDFTTATKFVDFPFKVKSSAMKILNPTEEIDIKYIFYLISTIKIDRDLHKRYWISTFSNIKISLPSLTKQKQIAKRLDKAKELIELRQDSIKKLDELSKSIFIDMFGDPVSNPMGFELINLGTVIKIDAPMVQPNTKEYENLYLIGSDRIEKNTGKILPSSTAKEDKVISKKFLFDNRYILYSKIRPYLNKVAIATFTGLCSADMYPLRPMDNKINKEYLLYRLLSKHFLQYTETLPDRASIPKLNRKELVKYKFPLPPIKLQNNFADIIQKIEQQKSLYQKQLIKLQENFDALLSESFSV